MDSPIDIAKKRYPDKFAPEERIFGHIHRGAKIFVGTGCGEPQHLVKTLARYVESHPKAFFDAEVIHVWTLGVAPYAEERFKANFRLNSFFIGHSTREAVNAGAADYTPVFLSVVPDLIRRGRVPVDVALIQTSLPDEHGYMSLGVSVDIVKAATLKASLVIAQVNRSMPRVHGDGFLHLEDVSFVVPHDEPIIEYRDDTDDETAQKIGKYVARLVRDEDTIQVGYGAIPNAVLANLAGKKDLGVHTELLSDGIVDLMKRGVVNNRRKTLDRGKTVATFCMGSEETYAFINDNPTVEFKTIDYTNHPLVIARQKNMTAINSALEIDLTGAATAESLGEFFYSGIGGQADFMRGALLAPNGKTILALPSTAERGKISRIVPFLRQGADATLNRGDIHYVVTEYGIAYLHGKNIRERALELISIAHPRHKSTLMEKARKKNLVYTDQAFIPGKKGEYPEDLETYRTTSSGLEIFVRPVKMSDESALQDFFHDLSDNSLYRRFLSLRRDMPHPRVQEFTVVDYTRDLILLAFLPKDEDGIPVAMGQFNIMGEAHLAEVAFAVLDDHQGRGIATEMLDTLTFIGKKRGLLGFTASVLVQNRPMLRVFEKAGFRIEPGPEEEVHELKLLFT